MDQPTHTEQVSNALAAYRTYRRQPPAERRLATYIDIIDSIFPPLSSSNSADDLLLLTLLMTDPNTLGHGHTHATDQQLVATTYQPDSKEFHGGLQSGVRPTRAMSHPSLASATHAQATHAASGINRAPVAKQHPSDPPSNINYPMFLTDSSQAYQDMYVEHNVASGRIPAPQFFKSGPVGHNSAPAALLPPTTDYQVSDHLRPRPRPRPRPQPVPNPATVPTPVHATPELGPEPAPVSVPTPIKVHPTTANTNKGKGRAMSTTPCPPAKPIVSIATGSLVGHGLVRFDHTPPRPSGLQIKRCPTPGSTYPASTFISVKPKPEFTFQHHQYPAYIPPISTYRRFGALKSSGRQSSPIDLCASSDAVDEDDLEIVPPAELVDIPEEWDVDGLDEGLGDGDEPDELEGFEEAHQRAASTARSSSPISISNINEILEKGGDPVMDPDALHAFLVAGRRGKLWLLVEKGLIIMHVFDPNAPEDCVKMALRPLNLRRCFRPKRA
ncbi:unnamed protein product [Rhizoctonia solani]|uniref:Uncharacterized protein n=1 Tax=Rhizoctonia solani TaxID=456999 RepID=A0A8H3AN22_9AGAM|nr:unnamed protein product [Rhizoctonia solani]